TVEEAGYDARPTAAGIAELLAAVPRLTPRLADATFVSAWAGLRPATSDGLPLLGRLPGWHGVTTATGHFRNGILLAPITGAAPAPAGPSRSSRCPTSTCRARAAAACPVITSISGAHGWRWPTIRKRWRRPVAAQ